MLGGSGVIALYGIACLLACAIVAISIALSVWLTALIVGAAVLPVAGAAALVGRTRLKSTAPMPEQAMSRITADINELRSAESHRRPPGVAGSAGGGDPPGCLVKAAVDRGAAGATHKVTGTWRGDESE